MCFKVLTSFLFLFKALTYRKFGYLRAWGLKLPGVNLSPKLCFARVFSYSLKYFFEVKIGIALFAKSVQYNTQEWDGGRDLKTPLESRQSL